MVVLPAQGDPVSSLAEGAARAASVLDDGSAEEKLEALVRCSQESVD